MFKERNCIYYKYILLVIKLDLHSSADLAVYMGQCVRSYISSNFQTHELKCAPGRKLTSELCFKFNLQITQERIGPHENTMFLSF